MSAPFFGWVLSTLAQNSPRVCFPFLWGYKRRNEAGSRTKNLKLELFFWGGCVVRDDTMGTRIGQGGKGEEEKKEEGDKWDFPLPFFSLFFLLNLGKKCEPTK